LLLLIHLRNNC